MLYILKIFNVIYSKRRYKVYSLISNAKSVVEVIQKFQILEVYCRLQNIGQCIYNIIIKIENSLKTTKTVQEKTYLHRY